MTAPSDVQPALYHGTRRGFTRGGYLFPADFHGKAPRAGHQPGGTAYVYMTTDLELAWFYAEQAKGPGKPKVLVVMPLGPVQADPSTYDGEEDQYRTEAAKVVAVHKERPPCP